MYTRRRLRVTHKIERTALRHGGFITYTLIVYYVRIVARRRGGCIVLSYTAHPSEKNLSWRHIVHRRTFNLGVLKNYLVQGNPWRFYFKIIISTTL